MYQRKDNPSGVVNRYTTSDFWTPDKDNLIRKLEAAGVRIEKIAARLGVTPRSVKRRSYHLRGIPFPSHAQELRAKSAELREERKRRAKAVMKAVRKTIARGTHQDAVITKALTRGIGPKAIAEELGVSRQLIYRRIWQGAIQDRRAIATHQKNEERRAAKALAQMRDAIARGVARDTAISRARDAGATYDAIGKALGLTRQRVHQIFLLMG